MYKRILIPVDNSIYSKAAVTWGVRLARIFGSSITGLHVFAARLHDNRFKQMEVTLPERYKAEETLSHQRLVHKDLITRGLEMISQSYMTPVRAECEKGEVPFESVILEGKNWHAIVRHLYEYPHDLIVLGAKGMGGCEGVSLGSVCERVVRKADTDTLVIKRIESSLHGPVVAAVDGSDLSFEGLRAALLLGKTLGLPVEAVAAYDPYLHQALFEGLSGVLSAEASSVFRLKEQGDLHEAIIDKGLGEIYRAHLERGRQMASQHGVSLEITLLAGRPVEKLSAFVEERKAGLLVMGKTGIHGDPSPDMGSVSENLLRLVSCDVLICSRRS